MDSQVEGCKRASQGFRLKARFHTVTIVGSKQEWAQPLFDLLCTPETLQSAKRGAQPPRLVPSTGQTLSPNFAAFGSSFFLSPLGWRPSLDPATAGRYWNRAANCSPGTYVDAENWLRATGRAMGDWPLGPKCWRKKVWKNVWWLRCQNALKFT